MLPPGGGLREWFMGADHMNDAPVDWQTIMNHNEGVQQQPTVEVSEDQVITIH